MVFTKKDQFPHKFINKSEIKEQLVFFEKIFRDVIGEAAKAFVPYFEVLQDGFVKRPCDADKQTIKKRNKIRKLNYL